MCQVWSSNSTQPLIDTHIYYGGSTIYCNSTPGNNGNITQIKDWRNPNRTRYFGYDALNRLSSFSNGYSNTDPNYMYQTYSYDSFGNLSQSGTLSSALSFDGNNRINSGGYGYDAAGNINSYYNGVFTSNYVFDAESRVFNVNSGAGYYTYDAAGERVRKDANGTYTEYQYFNGQPIAEKNSDGTWSDYIYTNGQKIARADSFDARLHSHGTCGTSVCVVTWQIPTAGGYKIQSGDKLVWRQFQGGGGQGGLDVAFQDGTQTAWNLNDSNNQSANAMTTQNQWVNRSADFTNFINEIVQGYYLFTNNTTPPGTWTSITRTLQLSAPTAR